MGLLSSSKRTSNTTNYTDNRSQTSIDNRDYSRVDTDIDNSVRIDADIDNSQQWDVDNSQEWGDVSGIVGSGNTMVITDGGAFDLAGSALAMAEEVTDNAINSNSAAIDQVVALSGDVVGEAINLSNDAIARAGSATEQAFNFADDALSTNRALITEGLNSIADLASETALDGQTVVAETAGKMVMYLAGAVALVAAALVLGGRS
ncbi:hypothetical protein [Ferrimonas balearica]|uniref:hypothetical protein n=1 Tax=Ferrimonas balearica TaxID=44012 RepID=UPI001C98EAA3|nr:hypothetical protein [Ferrimonas balearica]MBY5920417.1 hypothetical protein [Ferrimonas balearica]MBY5996898.1 hypothetical protein [Ferrimonas balearica]